VSLRGLRNALASFVPKWMQNRPGRNVGFRYLYVFAQLIDVMIEQVDQGVQASWPGVGTPTALPLIGQSRGLGRGEAETDGHYATRLVRWLDTWAEAGSDAMLVTQIQNYLGNTPTVRVIDRSGFWVSIAPDGTVSRATAAWDWDSHSNPERAGWWSDLWIIVYPTEWAITGSTLSTLVGKWGTPDPGTGHATTRVAHDAILGLVATWKGAHTKVQAIVWSYDASLFDPASPSAPGNPDGYWGFWGKDDGSGSRIPARNLTCRYWIPQAD